MRGREGGACDVTTPESPPNVTHVTSRNKKKVSYHFRLFISENREPENPECETWGARAAKHDRVCVNKWCESTIDV